MSRRRPLIIEVPIDNIIVKDDEQPSFLYCAYNKMGLSKDTPTFTCASRFGIRGCGDCKYAYVQLIERKKSIKDVEELLEIIGAKPVKEESKKQGRFENIL
jgi:hypothetical protein